MNQAKRNEPAAAPTRPVKDPSAKGLEFGYRWRRLGVVKLKDLAAELAMDQSQLSRIFRGKVDPQSKTAAKIEAVLSQHELSHYHYAAIEEHIL